MILLRQALEKDIDGLEALSQLAAERYPGFINIAKDADQWKGKVQHSNNSFLNKVEKNASKYIFVAEDLNLQTIVGLSMVSAQHGTMQSPHFFFEVGSEQKFSKTINTGFIHGTLKLNYDTDGPTEIGGLLVDPEHRNTDEKIGRQISFIRFLYIGLNKLKFKKKILAELLPPLTKKGKSPLWEAVGRRFMNMDYAEADAFSTKDKEFILSLIPTEKIYTTFLTAEARNAIGKVSPDTEPVMHMLTKIGFNYDNQVDPFDGGPHLTANLEEILPIQKIQEIKYVGASSGVNLAVPQQSFQGLVTAKHSDLFSGISVEVQISGTEACFSEQKAAAINIKPGDLFYFMPYY